MVSMVHKGICIKNDSGKMDGFSGSWCIHHVSAGGKFPFCVSNFRDIFGVTQSGCNVIAIFVVKIDVCGITLDMNFITVINCPGIVVQTVSVFLHLSVMFVAPDMSMGFDFAERQSSALFAYIICFFVYDDRTDGFVF